MVHVETQEAVIVPANSPFTKEQKVTDVELTEQLAPPVVGVTVKVLPAPVIEIRTTSTGKSAGDCILAVNE